MKAARTTCVADQRLALRATMKSFLLSLAVACAAFAPFNGKAATFYVDLNNSNPEPPYGDWSTAATNIQDAIDASNPGDLVLVTNGVYQAGGRTVNGFSLTNRVVIDKAVTVQSVNGPAFTLIEGYQVASTTNGDSALRCVYMTNSAVLIGFTLTNGATRLAYTDDVHEASGGGVWCEDSTAVVSNCFLVANAADYTDGVGGGASGGTLEYCTLVGNSALNGGGVYNGVLENCTLTNNSAPHIGGAAWSSTLNDCVLGGNSAGAGGGAFSSTLTGCLITNNTANQNCGGANGVLNNCTIVGNRAGSLGGGTYFANVTNCTLIGNSAYSGGGANSGNLEGCNVTSNSASGSGGGTASSTVIDCKITGNSSPTGGGANAGSLINCIISRNIAALAGAGAYGAVLSGSALVANYTSGNGGGAAGSILNDCTLAGNSAEKGGGAYSCSLTNSLIYYNTATLGTNYQSGSLDHCCTTPLPAGSGNIADEPRLADLFHLSATSPCLGAGDSAYASGVDIDNEQWANPPAIGCDEFYSGSLTGVLNVAIGSFFTNLAVGFPGSFTALIDGHASMSVWDFGDGTIVTNQPYATHSWTTPGSYQISLRAFNQSNPDGISASIMVQVALAPVQYVAAANSSPAAPYLSWASAATNIQNAVDAAFGGGMILVSNGVYQTGGRPAPGHTLTNRVVITKPITIASVNGPAVTVINGYKSSSSIGSDIRCVYLGDGANLSGFTLANGAAPSNMPSDPDANGGGLLCQSTNAVASNCFVLSNYCSCYGAGIYSGTLSNCRIDYNTSGPGSFNGSAVAFSIISDSTVNSNYVGFGSPIGAGFSCIMSNCIIAGNSSGGGVSSCLLNDCTVQNNLNSYNGGGAIQSALYTCAIVGNQASASGGGAWDCLLSDCIISNNSAASWGGGVYDDSRLTNAPGQNNLVISNSAGRFGGGLYLAFGNWAITNWNFSGNSSTQDGGGFYITSSQSTVKNCTFTGNFADGNGAGFCSSSAASLPMVFDSDFNGNRAIGNGGGAYYAALNNCSIRGNYAVNGGGVFGAVTNCVLNGNVATTNGGGLYVYGGGFAPNCSFTNNFAANGGGSYGGIFSNCAFFANTAATNGGAVYSAAMKGCLVVSNRAAFGGGVYAGTPYPGTPFAYIGCDLIGNSAHADGGGIYNALSVTGTNCLLEANSALGNGGGAYGGYFDRTVFSGNIAGTNGGGAYTCNASLCIFSNNVAGANGGGTYNSSVLNCLLNGNSAVYGGGAYVGGTYSGSLQNSTVVNNTASASGGGIYYPGGGVFSCIIYDNFAPIGMNYSAGASYNYCCTTPLPSLSSQTITNDPSFINYAAGNFRLQTNSPCINAGTAGSGTVDLDGRPRYVGGRIDIGAYEFQGPGVGEFIAWLQGYGLPTDGSADYVDTDGDGMNNWQEWIAGTDPTNPLSVLKMLGVAFTNSGTGELVSWQSVSNRTYFLQRSGALLGQPAFSTIQSNILGQVGSTSFMDTNSMNSGPFFYRVGIE